MARKSFWFFNIALLLLVIVVFTSSVFLLSHKKNSSKSQIKTLHQASISTDINNFNIDNIFEFVSPDILSKKSDNPDEFTIIATGDVIPARSVNWKMTGLNNFYYPFEKTDKLLKSGDITLINLESPLISDCKPTTEGMVFCGDQKFAKSLSDAGVKVINFANNHSTNYGKQGAEQTWDILNNYHLKTEGFGQPVIIEVRGKKFGFLGYNDIGVSPLVASADAVFIKQDIESLKKQVDFVIASFHWGVEYTSTPSARQLTIAHETIDAGADLIIGNHPHWTQGIEKYKNKVVTYAHGNYIFDQMWSQETREGVIGKYTFNKTGLINIKFIPIIIDDYSQPRFASLAEGKNILSKMKASSEQINQKY